MSHISQQVRACKNAGDIFNLARSMKDPKERQIFITEYCAFIIETHKKDGQTITIDDARDILKSNLGYFAGYYGDDVRKEIEEMYGAEHPVFGSIIKEGPPSTTTAFYAGIRLGLQRGKNEDAPPGVRARHRPPNFEQLSAQEQWEIDKGLGILDWDGTHD